MSNHSPLVSVLVPICNVERYLRKCLKFLVRQTLEDIEIICIDDGSTDASPQIIAEYAENDARIKVITKPNSGYGDSMNKGLELAQGEYIAIVESDDFIDEDGLERMVTLAQDNDVEVVKTNFYTHMSGIDYHEDPILPNLEHCSCGVVLDPREKQDIFLTQPAIWSALYRRDFLTSNKIDFLPTPGASFQDTSFNFKVFACARRVFLSNEACLHYRIDNTNSSVKSLEKVFCICDEYAEMWRFLEERGLLETLGKRLAQVQYGGYHWNLHRLTPNLQYPFYQRFVEDFRQLQERGLLDEAVFDEAVWQVLSSMLEDSEGFFQEHLGPIPVERSFAVIFSSSEPKAAQKALRKLTAVLSQHDELICLYDAHDAAFTAMIVEAHAQDARIIDGMQLVESETFKTIESKNIRGREFVALDLPDLRTKSLQRVISWVKTGMADQLVCEGAIGCCYETRDLADDVRVLFCGLLAGGFYGKTGFQKEDSSYYPALIARTSHFTEGTLQASKKDYLAARSAFDGLIEWLFANEACKTDRDLLRRIYTSVLVPLWAELLRIYDALSYNERTVLGAKPSSLDYPALEIAKGGAPADQAGAQNASDPELSVIIPVYNAEEYVLMCLESVLGQEGVSIQVICIDDGSSDRSVAIMEEIAQVDDRLSVYAELNGGAGAARNRGIDLAQGRFLAFIDPDDYYPSSSSLAQLYAAALQNGAKMCGGSFISFLPSGEVRLSYYGDETPYTIKEAGFRSLEQDQFDYGWIRFIYQRELFSEQGLRFPLYRWYEDPVFFVNALALAGEYYVIPEPVYCYREDYKEPSWSAAKIRDMLAGIAHNLAFAQRNDLDGLYTRLIYRIDYDYGKAILDAIDDEEVLARIADIQGSLEVDRVAYLKEKGYEVYILKPLYYRVCAERKTAVRRLAEKLEASGLYKTMQTHYERFRKRR